MFPFSTFRAHRRRGQTGLTLIVGARNQLVSRRIIATYYTEGVHVVGVQLGGEVAHLVEAEKSTFRGELSFSKVIVYSRAYSGYILCVVFLRLLCGISSEKT
jgi:hypothetical protein